jgi:hypothetical protein
MASGIAFTASAQKAALTRDIDRPGAAAGVMTCRTEPATSFTCKLVPAIPVDMRFITSYLSYVICSTSPVIRVQVDDQFASDFLSLPSSSFNAAGGGGIYSVYTFGAPYFTVWQPGEAPLMSVFTAGSAPLLSSCGMFVTVRGHYESL